MKKIVVILVIGLFSLLQVRAQGVINFDINFGTNPPPHTSGGLDSAARLATDGTFFAVLYLGSTSPDSAFVGRLDGETFTPEFQFTYQFIELQIWEYGYLGSWQLTDTQVQNLLAGQWYAKVIYSDVSYIGQLTPVPEPSSFCFFTTGIILLCWLGRRPNTALEPTATRDSVYRFGRRFTDGFCGRGSAFGR